MDLNKEQTQRKNLSFQIKSINKIHIKIQIILTYKILKYNQISQIKFFNNKTKTYQNKNHKLKTTL